MYDRAQRVQRLMAVAESYIDDSTPWEYFLGCLISESEMGRPEWLDTITEPGVFQYVKELYAAMYDIHEQDVEGESYKRLVHDLHPGG